jgi:cytochrome c oxidase subunit 2
LWPVIVAGAMSTVLTGCVSDEIPEVSADDAELVTGREVYARNCVACHGAAGQGGTGPKLSDGAVVERYPDIADHIDIIVNGRNQMPAYGGKLTDDEIEAVVRYNREVL